MGAHYNRLAMDSATKLKRLIVNADDFGFSPGITEGILRAHREGIVTSTTIAANMPSAGAAAAQLREYPELGVGVHLNVSQGPPLSERGRALAGPDGVMNRTAAGVILCCLRHPAMLVAMEAEFDAQIRWALDHGIRPTHLDSHRHAHAFGPIFARVAALARRYHIRFVRWHGETLSGGGWPRRPAKQQRIAWALNALAAANACFAPQLRATRGTWGVVHTGAIDAGWLIRAMRALRAGVTEIMTHPGLAEGLDPAQTRLRESRLAELAALCDPAVKKALRNYDIELTHYGRL